MTSPAPIFNQVNLVVADVDATVAFYRRLGLDIPDGPGEWPPGSGAHHAEANVATATGTDADLDLAFDNEVMAAMWNAGRRGGAGSVAVIGFRLGSRDEVDERHADLVGAGYRSRQEPYDAFWGARYAVVADPDGNDVGLMSPVDPDRRYTPDG